MLLIISRLFAFACCMCHRCGAGGGQPCGFWFQNDTTLWLAVSDSGLQQFTRNWSPAPSGTFAFKALFKTPDGHNPRGLTGMNIAGLGFRLFVTSVQPNTTAQSFVWMVDPNNAGSTAGWTRVLSSAPNYVLRSVMAAPIDPALPSDSPTSTRSATNSPTASVSMTSSPTATISTGASVSSSYTPTASATNTPSPSRGPIAMDAQTGVLVLQIGDGSATYNPAGTQVRSRPSICGANLIDDSRPP